MSDSIHFAEIPISVSHKIGTKYLYQYFSFNRKKKDVKLIRDSRYILYAKFERKIREFSLTTPGIIEFLRRFDEENYILLKYEVVDWERFDKYSLKNYIFKVVDWVPPNPGCAYCIHKEELGDGTFFRCCYKNKTMTKELKTCKYFSQKRLKNE